MYNAMLALHLLTAVFAVGPLVYAATTAARALRLGDAAAAAGSARILRIYSYASVAVVIFGFALMSTDAPWGKGEKVAEFSDAWIWISVVLWLVSMALTLGVLAPTLQKAATTASESARELTVRVAATGGVVGLIYTAIIVLMVYRPGG